jgi:hypothetical protein
VGAKDCENSGKDGVVVVAAAGRAFVARVDLFVL